MFQAFKQVKIELFKAENKFERLKLGDVREYVKIKFGFRLDLDEETPEVVRQEIERYFPGLNQYIENSANGSTYTIQVDDQFEPLVLRFYEHHEDRQPRTTPRRPLFFLKEAMVAEKIKLMCISGTCCIEFKFEEKVSQEIYGLLFFRFGTKMWVDVEKAQVETFDIKFAPQHEQMH